MTKSDDIRHHVDNCIKEGREKKLGWIMSEILEDVSKKLGYASVKEARQYIVVDICKLEE
jgi:hypothetical protein